MLRFGTGRRVKSYFPAAALILLAWIAYSVGSTLGVALTIFAVLVWAAVGLIVVYAVLFRGMRFTLFDDEEPSAEEIIEARDERIDEARAVAAAERAATIDEVEAPAVTERPSGDSGRIVPTA